MVVAAGVVEGHSWTPDTQGIGTAGGTGGGGPRSALGRAQEGHYQVTSVQAVPTADEYLTTQSLPLHIVQKHQSAWVGSRVEEQRLL